MNKLITTKEVCETFRIHPITLKKLVDKGLVKRYAKCRPVKGGQLTYRYDLEEITKVCVSKGYIDETEAQSILWVE